MALSKTSKRLESIDFLYDLGTDTAPGTGEPIGIRATVSFAIEEDGANLGERVRQVVDLMPRLTVGERTGAVTLIKRLKALAEA